MHRELEGWIRDVAELTKPDRVVWCDGSEEEYRQLIDLQIRSGTLVELNQRTYPGCHLHRSDPQDVARVEHLTFICSEKRENAGPTNNWMSPQDAERRVKPLFAGAMRGRTMYVVPYIMGPKDSSLARVGVEITDSPYVVISMRTMTRMGADKPNPIHPNGISGFRFQVSAFQRFSIFGRRIALLILCRSAAPPHRPRCLSQEHC